MDINIKKETLVKDLTIGELMEFLKNERNINAEKKEQENSCYLRGIKGVAVFFKVGISSAKKMCATILKPAVHKQKKILLVDKDLARKLFEGKTII